MPEVSAQVLVESIVTLNQPAVKIDEIRAVVQNLRCIVIPNKVIFQGIVHKQIFFVREDSLVAHQAEDVRFNGFVDVPGVTPNMTCTAVATIEFIDFTLLDPTSLEQKVIVLVTIVTPAVIPTVSPTVIPPTMFPTGTIPVTLSPGETSQLSPLEVGPSGIFLVPDPRSKTFFGTTGPTTVTNAGGTLSTVGTFIPRPPMKRVLG